jgi:hypothetical protein
MKKFACPKCDKIFSQQVTLDYHLNKKNPCDKFLKEPENQNNIEIINAKKIREYLDDLKCVYCKKQFTRKNNVLYHIEHNCKKVKEIEEEKHKIFLKLKEEEETRIKQQDEEKNKIKLLEEEVLKLKNALENKDKNEEKLIKEISKIKKTITKVSHTNSHNTKTTVSNSNNISNSNNTDNSIKDSNIQQNIFLANYTGNGMPPIPNEEILPLLKRGFQTSVELTKKIHFNPKYPEFHMRARNKIMMDPRIHHYLICDLATCIHSTHK